MNEEQKEPEQDIVPEGSEAAEADSPETLEEELSEADKQLSLGVTELEEADRVLEALKDDSEATSEEVAAAQAEAVAINQEAEVAANEARRQLSQLGQEPRIDIIDQSHISMAAEGSKDLLDQAIFVKTLMEDLQRRDKTFVNLPENFDRIGADIFGFNKQINEFQVMATNANSDPHVLKQQQELLSIEAKGISSSLEMMVKTLWSLAPAYRAVGTREHEEFADSLANLAQRIDHMKNEFDNKTIFSLEDRTPLETNQKQEPTEGSPLREDADPERTVLIQEEQQVAANDQAQDITSEELSAESVASGATKASGPAQAAPAPPPQTAMIPTEPPLRADQNVREQTPPIKQTETEQRPDPTEPSAEKLTEQPPIPAEAPENQSPQPARAVNESSESPIQSDTESKPESQIAPEITDRILVDVKKDNCASLLAKNFGELKKACGNDVEKLSKLIVEILDRAEKNDGKEGVKEKTEIAKDVLRVEQYLSDQKVEDQLKDLFGDDQESIDRAMAGLRESLFQVVTNEVMTGEKLAGLVDSIIIKSEPGDEANEQVTFDKKEFASIYDIKDGKTTIYLYGKMFEMQSSEQARVFSHELGHVIIETTDAFDKTKVNLLYDLAGQITQENAEAILEQGKSQIPEFNLILKTLSDPSKYAGMWNVYLKKRLSSLEKLPPDQKLQEQQTLANEMLAELTADYLGSDKTPIRCAEQKARFCNGSELQQAISNQDLIDSYKPFTDTLNQRLEGKGQNIKSQKNIEPKQVGDEPYGYGDWGDYGNHRRGSDDIPTAGADGNMIKNVWDWLTTGKAGA